MTAPSLHLFVALSFTLSGLSCTRLTPTVAQVSGRAVEVVEAGAGDVTVVFEAGLGNDWSAWDDVASRVARGARVFAYSRPGYGRSAPTTEERTARRIVEDLRSLLAARGHAPPYVLVGHSFGGTYLELFARAHPEEVVGLVLVDSRHRDFTAACQRAGFTGCSLSPAMVSSLPQTDRAEFEGFATVSAEIDAAGRFGPYPVRALTASSHGGSPGFEALWESMLGALAREAVNGEQVLFPGTSHNLEVERPKEISELILQLVSGSST